MPGQPPYPQQHTYPHGGTQPGYFPYPAGPGYPPGPAHPPAYSPAAPTGGFPGYPPTTLTSASAVNTPQESTNSTNSKPGSGGTITQEHLRMSILSAVEDKVLLGGIPGGYAEACRPHFFLDFKPK